MRILGLLMTILAFVPLHAQILVEENGQAVSRSYESVKTASEDLRQGRRVALGMSAAGHHGVFGVDLELNFTQDMGISIGYGLGDPFESFSLRVKKQLGGNWLSPYFVGGFSRWFAESGDAEAIESSSPTFLKDKFLTETEIQQGKFAHSILYPGFGLQYFQISGPWTGASVYLEILFLVDTRDFEAAPTGGAGFLYYF